MADNWPDIPSGAGYPLVDATSGEFLSTLVRDSLSATSGAISAEIMGAISAALEGADPTAATDAGAALQASVDEAIAQHRGAVFVPPGVYLVNQTIVVPDTLVVYGQSTTRTDVTSRLNRIGGTVLIPGPGLPAGAAVLKVAKTSGLTPSFGLYGTKIKDLFFLGSNHFNTSAGARDHTAIHLQNVLGEISIENVNITGFLRHAYLFEGVYDGTIIGGRIHDCGTDNVYAALDYRDGEGNVNAIHTFGLHIEACPYILRVAGEARHNQFVACKFEMYSAVALAGPPIRITGNAREQVFVGTQFVQRNTDDSSFYSSITAQPHMILVDGGNARVTFTSNFFTTQGYAASPGTPSQGSRWIKQTAGQVTITAGNQFDLCWGGGGEPAIHVNDFANFTYNQVWSRSIGGERNLMRLNNDCIVDGNTFRSADSAAVTAGSVFNVVGARNIFGVTNKFRSFNVNQYFTLGTNSQAIAEIQRTPFVISDNATTMNVGLRAESWTRLFNVSNTAATNVTALSGIGIVGDRVELVFTNGNTTLVHSGSLRLKGGVNVTPTAFSVMTFNYDGANWLETGRNF